MVLSSPLGDKITFHLNIFPAANNFFIHRNREIGMLKSEPYVLVEQRNSKLHLSHLDLLLITIFGINV